MRTDQNVKDVTIIGAGPVGLFAIFQCGMMGLSTQIVDSLDDLGGQCTALYPEKPIYDIPAYPQINGGDLITSLIKQANRFEYNTYLSQQITDIKQNDTDKVFTLKTSKDITLKSRAIIIAAGAGAFGPNRPPLENIEKFEGESVFYYVKNSENFKDKNIVIAGGGDSAIDWTLALQPIAKSITLVHRRDKFGAHPDSIHQMQELASQGKINLKTGWQLDKLQGNQSQLTHISLKNFNNETITLDTDALLPFYGLSANLGPIKNWNIETDNNKVLVDPLTQKTSKDGIFAIGDICTYPNKLDLILTGFSEAALASNQIRDYLHPGEVFHFQHSTSSLDPKSLNTDH